MERMIYLDTNDNLPIMVERTTRKNVKH